jgi:hypothetical protein
MPDFVCPSPPRREQNQGVYGYVVFKRYNGLGFMVVRFSIQVFLPPPSRSLGTLHPPSDETRRRGRLDAEGFVEHYLLVYFWVSMAVVKFIISYFLAYDTRIKTIACTVSG